MQEEWRDIQGYEGLYMVSDHGNVKSLNYHLTGKERLLSLSHDKDGYLLVALYKNGRGRHFKVHRLVAMAFIPNPDNLPDINHKDECKSMNHVSNLEWCTRAYNDNYGTRNARTAEKNKTSMLNHPSLSKIVMQYTKGGAFVAEYPSSAEASRKTGVRQCCIGFCCQGKPNHRTAGGYVWRYKVSQV